MMRSKLLTASGMIVATCVPTWAAPPTQTPDQQTLDAWSDYMMSTEPNDDACHAANYPSTEWRTIPCHDPKVADRLRLIHPTPHARQRPASDVQPGASAPGRPAALGTISDDYVAYYNYPLTVTEAVGQFTSYSGTGGEHDTWGPQSFSVQLNPSTNPDATACAGSHDNDCYAWAQFVYSTLGENEGGLQMQFWLVNYGYPCPEGIPHWTSAPPDDCFVNSTAVSVPHIDVSMLPTLRLAARLASKGRVNLAGRLGGALVDISSPDYAELAGFWSSTEFNVLGNGNASAAVFDPGTTLEAQLISVPTGGTAPVKCGLAYPSTGESNNLNLITCNASGAAIKFKESN